MNTQDHTLLLMEGRLTSDRPPAKKSVALRSATWTEHTHTHTRCAHTNSKQMWLVWSLSKSLGRPFMSSGERPVKAFISSPRTDLCNKQLQAWKVTNDWETFIYKPTVCISTFAFKLWEKEKDIRCTNAISCQFITML